METNSDVIKDGDYVIIKRQEYYRIHKMSKDKCSVMLGKDEVDLTAALGQTYWSTYKLERKDDSKRSYTLTRCKREVSFADNIKKESTCGVDNREIKDDGLSQKLSSEEIINLRSCGLSGQEIVTQLVENSKTFLNKTEFSQEKYLRKKEKKYFEYITIRKPTFRLILDVLLKQPTKFLCLRMDTVAQITALANVRSSGTYILYENGCSGIISAALLDRMGAHGFIIHVYSGNNEHPCLAVQALNLSKEKLSHLMSIDISRLCEKRAQSSYEKAPLSSGRLDVILGSKRKSDDPTEVTASKKRKLEIEDRVRNILNEQKADALIICGKEHPINIFKNLVKFLEISRPFVVYCSVREPLQEMYFDLKNRNDVVSIRMTENMIRGYQVLPDRTHPEINISGTGGYILTGTYVSG